MAATPHEPLQSAMQALLHQRSKPVSRTPLFDAEAIQQELRMRRNLILTAASFVVLILLAAISA